MASRIFLTRALPEEGLEPLRRAGHRLHVHPSETAPDPHELREAARGAAGLITLLSDRVDAALLDAAGSELRIVANYAVGTDNIDLEACRARGVAVANTPDVLTEATADLALALLLAVARRVVEGDRLVRSGDWRGWHPSQLLGTSLHGRRFGVVGPGRIGAAAARRAAGFGMAIAYHARSRHEALHAELDATRLPLEELLATSDVVSLHVPLTPETRHLIDAEALARMKPDAILVNTARGGVVDEPALVRALREGRLGGAGLDVYEGEPRVRAELRDLPNVVLTPHLGSATVTTRVAMARLASSAVVAVLAGEEAPNLVVPPPSRDARRRPGP